MYSLSDVSNGLGQFLASKQQAGQSIVSVVTSGDIDAVVIHLFALNFLWKCDGDVYVVLQKPGHLLDIYNVTAILQLLQNTYEDPLPKYQIPPPRGILEFWQDSR